MSESIQAVAIIGGARTAIGAFQGVFSDTSATELGASASREALRRSGLDAALIDEVLIGCVLPAGLGQAPARQVALSAGLPVTVPCTTVNKMCGSGMKAVMMAADQIRAGACQTVMAGGIENMTRAPYLIPKARAGLRLGHAEIKDHMFLDGLEDAYSGRLMGSFAQETADRFGLSRQQMDDYAINSLQRAQRAITEGWFRAESVSVHTTIGRREIEVIDDEQPGKASIEKIPRLRPAFAADGTITAANASSISDGAASLILASEQATSQHAVAPLAYLLAQASHAREPGEFTMAPIGAIEKVLKASGWSVNDVDLFEINEAFAMVPLLAIQALGLDHDNVNIHGGACALGHPIGASGARVIVTLMHALQRLGKRRGIASLCIGGGEAVAVAIEMA